MQLYPVRTSHRRNLEPAALAPIAQEAFGSAKRDGDAVVAHFGAIRAISVRSRGRELEIDLTMDPKVDVEIAAETVRRYNLFLERATGYSAKERAKKLRKSAGASED
ncbi:MAG: DUF5611 family protein [Thermoplasmata archaeon]